jgi:hypothetical protein
MGLAEFSGDMAEILVDLQQKVRIRGESITAIVDDEVRSADVTDQGVFAEWMRDIVIPEAAVKGRTWKLNEAVFVGERGYAIADVRKDDLTGDVRLSVKRRDESSVI